MRYAIFSDIHSNIEALEAVLKELEKENIDKYICCGDIVGYGPDPNECIERVRNIHTVAGNHDRAAIGQVDISKFNDRAKAAIQWTTSAITGENKNFLASLPKKIVGEDFTIVHGSPRDPINEYLLDIFAMSDNMEFFTTKMCFVGHSHHPFIYNQNDGLTKVDDGQTAEITSKTIINVGSVGQPRDGDNRACFITLEDNRIKLFRIKYDIEAVQEKMKKHNLPESLITRLSHGR
ncbi:MAG: metallophosphoesterase family protein [Elusimicrobia bacterium]|nr:metallophosphoesterase family protein [Elusimicrobiota bacterium]